MTSEKNMASDMISTPATLGELPDGWTWSSLKSVCEGIFDCPHSTPKLASAGPYLARTQDIVSGTFRLDSAARVSRYTYDERVRRAKPRRGDLLYSREGTYFGIAAEVPESVQVCLGQRMILIRPYAKSIDFRFLRYWLNSPAMQSHIHGHRDGSVAERLNLTTIRALPTLTPPLDVQGAIAAALGALDDKIEANERIAATSEQLCCELLSEELWSARTRVDALADLRKAQVVPVKLDVPKVAHFSLPAYDSGKAPEFAHPQSIKSSKFLVDEPVVLLSKLNPNTPRVWNVIPEPGTTSLASTEFLVLKPRDNVRTAELWAALSQPTLSAELAAKVTGTSKSHQRVRPAEIMSSEVVDPREVQEATRDRVTSLADRLACARGESRTLTALRDTLLPQLMSGKLRVRDAERIVEDAV